MTETKQELRTRYRKARAALSSREKSAASIGIAERIAALPAYQAASVVMVYSALPDEVSLQPLIDRSASFGKRLVYPHCLNKTEMIAMLPGAWQEGMYGIREPAYQVSETIAPEAIDLVICPGVAFDESGTRLGAGGGYYDRFLPQCINAVRIMAAFEVQHAPLLPRAATDIAMEQIVTEADVYSSII